MTQPVPAKGPLVVIPFYRSPHLVRQLFSSLAACAGELESLGIRVIAINDSPDDSELAAQLAKQTADLRLTNIVEVVSLSVNQGFIGATNLGLTRAIETGSDVILLNSDTVVFPGALTEILAVAALDPMIGFVSPRSNNATICSIPRGAEFPNATPDTAFQSYLSVKRFLPRFQFVPTAVGFCLFIKSPILAELGKLDQAYGRGYDEENDLIMRANRVGFRAVIANHAFVYHQGEVSFSQTEHSKSVVSDSNSARLNERYPEFAQHVQEYNRSVRFRAEDLLSAALPARDGTFDLLFDCNSFGPYHNGTFEFGRKLLRHLAAQSRNRFVVYVQSSPEAANFHRLRSIPGVIFIPANVSRTFAVGIRAGQPFEPSHLLKIGRNCLCTIHVMLDSIAWDCLYLNRGSLEELWRGVFEAPNGVSYLSDFTRDQFARRFRKHPRLREMVNYASMAPEEYGSKIRTSQRGKYVLVVGNSFAHKFMNATLDKLVRAFPNERFLALGVESSPNRSVIAYPSGDLTNRTVHSLYANASLVIYPSFYEGFGLPILTAIAHKKPVFARDLPVSREIREQCGEQQNLRLYRTTDELVSMLRGGYPAWNPSGTSSASWTWASAGTALAEFAWDVFTQTTIEDDVIPRLESLDRLDPELAPRTASPHFVIPSVERIENGPNPPQNHSTAEDLKKRISDLENSLSWRLTSPLRILAKPLMEKKKGSR